MMFALFGLAATCLPVDMSPPADAPGASCFQTSWRAEDPRGSGVSWTVRTAATEPTQRPTNPTVAELDAALVRGTQERQFVTDTNQLAGSLSGRIDEFLLKLTDAPNQRPAVMTWRMLVLFYPNTRSNYKTLDGKDAFWEGGIPRDQIRPVEQGLRELSALAKWHSGGLVNLQVDVKTVERPVTFSAEGPHRLGFQYPQTGTDCAPEMALYNNPRHDSIIVVYNPGPIPQDLAGSGGGGLGGTEARLNYNGPAQWVQPPIYKLSTYIHEWMHGLDGFFLQQGYRIAPLHHLYASHYNAKWHSAVMQGRLIDTGEKMYGYSRAVWMSGTPTKRVSLPPVQPTSPSSFRRFPTGQPIRFEWAPTPAPSGYRLLIYRKNAYDTPIRAIEVPNRNVPGIWPDGLMPHTTVADLPAGEFVWTVVALDGTQRSEVGDAISITITAPASLPAIALSRVLHDDLIADGRSVPIVLSATSPAGISRVSATIELPNGDTLASYLRRRSPSENESTYAGELWIPPMAFAGQTRVSMRIHAVDHAGRTATGVVQTTIRGSNPGFAQDFPGEVPTLVVMPHPVIQTHATGSPTTLATSFRGGTKRADLKGRTWAEIRTPNGKTTWLSLQERGWDDADGSERYAYYPFSYDPNLPDYGWPVALCYRAKSGAVTRRELTFSLSPSRLDLPWSERALRPSSPQGLELSGFATRDDRWISQGNGVLSLPVEPTHGFRWRVRANAKNDVILFARDARTGPIGRPDMEGLSVVIGGWSNSLDMIRWNGAEVHRRSGATVPKEGPIEVTVHRFAYSVVVYVDGQYLMHAQLPWDAPATNKVGFLGGYGGQQVIESVEFTDTRSSETRRGSNPFQAPSWDLASVLERRARPENTSRSR